MTMKQFKNILYLAEGEDKAILARALELAAENRARLTVFDVLQPVKFNSSSPQTIKTLKDMQDSRLAGRREELQAKLDTLSGHHAGVKSRVEVRQGNTYLEVIKAVLEDHHDLVIKSRIGHLGPVQMVFGSTDLKLLRLCPCPVWIIKPSRRKHFARILAAVDPDPFNPLSGSLNRLIMALATSLAQMEGGQLHVVHAWHLVDETVLKDGHISHNDLQQLDREMQEAHQHQMDELLKHYPAQEMKVHLLRGEAEDVIPRLVHKQEIDLIVMGTVGRTGISGFLIGNTAEKILNSVDSSVLTVKPEGFKSPV